MAQKKLNNLSAITIMFRYAVPQIENIQTFILVLYRKLCIFSGHINVYERERMIGRGVASNKISPVSG